MDQGNRQIVTLFEILKTLADHTILGPQGDLGLLVTTVDRPNNSPGKSTERNKFIRGKRKRNQTTRERAHKGARQLVSPPPTHMEKGGQTRHGFLLYSHPSSRSHHKVQQEVTTRESTRGPAPPHSPPSSTVKRPKMPVHFYHH